MAVDKTQTPCAGAGIQSQLSGIRCPRLTSAVRNYFGTWPWQVRGDHKEENKRVSLSSAPASSLPQHRVNVVLIQKYKCHLQSHSGEERGERRVKKKVINWIAIYQAFFTVKIN